jgi:hypothetical protein
MISQSRAGQIQRKGEPHNSLRTRLTAALVHTYIEKWKLNQLKRLFFNVLLTVRLRIILVINQLNAQILVL